MHHNPVRKPYNRLAACRTLFNTQLQTKYDVHMNFRFNEEESRYITFPHHVSERSVFLKTLIHTKKPVIIDGFACVGGDSIIFMADFPTATVYAIQCVFSSPDKKRFSRLIHNVTAFNRTYGQNNAKALAVSSTIEEYLSNFNKPVDLLYLDPPWFTNGRERAHDVIMHHLNAVLKTAVVNVKFVVIKIKSNVNNADCFHGYKLIKSLAMNTSRKKAFYFHVFERAAHERQCGLSDAVDYCLHQRTVYSQHLRPEVRPEQEREKKINDQDVYVLEKNTCSCQSSPSAPHPTIPCASGHPKACEVHHSDAKTAAEIAYLVLPIDSAGMNC